VRRLRVHALRPGLTGEARLEPDATLCADPRWQVSEDCGDPVTCKPCLRVRARAKAAKNSPIAAHEAGRSAGRAA
jgi:hypothetical protein